MCSGLTAGAAIGCTALPLPGVGAAFDGIFFAAGEPAASPPDGAMPTVLLMLARAPRRPRPSSYRTVLSSWGTKTLPRRLRVPVPYSERERGVCALPALMAVLELAGVIQVPGVLSQRGGFDPPDYT